MLPPDVEALIADLTAAYRAAWAELEARRMAVLRGLNPIRRTETLTRLNELQQAVEYQLAVVDQAARRYLQVGLPHVYSQGAADAGVGFVTWTQVHVDALAKLASDTHADLLAASQEVRRTSAVFARDVREVARRRIPQGLVTSSTARNIGKDLQRDLSIRGITAVTYRNGSVYGLDTYAEMIARTKTAVAYNAGALNSAGESGVKFMEVFDGPTCGWDGHGDGDRANGTVRSVAECARIPISHPNCVRAFGARPDVTSRRQAKTADPSTTQAQRDAALVLERQRQGAQVARRARTTPEQRQAVLAARRAGRFA